MGVLLADPQTSAVRILDNFSSGRREHFVQHARDPRLKIHQFDLLDFKKALRHFNCVNRVFHLAANLDDLRLPPDAKPGLKSL